MKKMTHSTPAVTNWGWIGLGILAVMVIGTYGLIPPYYQSDSYHHFTDVRSFLGVTNTWNVLSNFPFLLVGLLGLARINKEEMKYGHSWKVFFTGLILVFIGSGWYHLSPDNESLFWDRLPMTVTFMGLLGCAAQEHFTGLKERITIPVLLGIGILSVLVWYVGNPAGSGDLRFYGLVQFGGTALATFWFLTSKRTIEDKKWILGATLLYAAAKLVESMDRPVSIILSGHLSGHSLKHLLAAGSAGCYLQLVNRFRRKTDEVPVNMKDGQSDAPRRRLLVVVVATGLSVLCGVLILRNTDQAVSKGFLWPLPRLGGPALPEGARAVHFPSVDGSRLEAWWIDGKGKKRDKPVILFLHGNAGNLDFQYGQFAYLADWGYDVLALDYRGFGNSEGTPSRTALREDSLAAMDYLKNKHPGRRYGVVGHSMGTVFAAQLAAARVGLDRMVLLAPFTAFDEIAEIALRNWGLSPVTARLFVRAVITARMDPIKTVEGDGLPPVLIVHGTADRVIPFTMGQRVYQAYRGDKRFLQMDGYSHENFHQGPLGTKYHNEIDGFLK